MKIRGRVSMKIVVAACLLLGLSATAANAIDLAELAPCKPAAARLCNYSGGMTWSNLIRCGATLAAHSWRVGSDCRAVLKKYQGSCDRPVGFQSSRCLPSSSSLKMFRTAVSARCLTTNENISAHCGACSILPLAAACPRDNDRK